MRVTVDRNCDVTINGVVTALFAGQVYDLPSGTALPDGVTESRRSRGRPKTKQSKSQERKDGGMYDPEPKPEGDDGDESDGEATDGE